MKKYKILSLLLVSLIMVSNITGCKSKNASTSSGIEFYKVDIDGEKEYLDQSDSNYNSIIEFIDSYISTVINVDYHNDDYLKQFDYEIKETRDYFEKVGYAEEFKADTIANQLIRSLDSNTVKDIELFTLGETQCALVSFEYTTSITNATPEYLSLVNQELNKKYKLTVRVKLDLEDGAWKLSEVVSLSEKTAV